MTTKIADIIVPDIFEKYVVEKTNEKSILIASGIVVPDPALDVLAQKGGNLIQMPYFNDLSGDSEVLSDQNPLTPGKITAGKDVARLQLRGKAWGSNDLVGVLAGADPMKAIGELVSNYWVRDEQKILIQTLAGVFADNAANDAGDLVQDVAIEAGASATAANLISGTAVIDAKTKLGDAADKLTAIAMHSVPYSTLEKAGLIEWVESGVEGGDKGKSKIPTFLGLTVLVDDGCPVVAGGTSGYKYTSYLFGRGAIGRGTGAHPEPVETARDGLAGESYLINRRAFLLHPRGIKWTETTCAGEAPTNAELALAVNWDRVYEKKSIRIVTLITNG